MNIKDFNELLHKKEDLENLWRVKKGETDDIRSKIDQMNNIIINLASVFGIPYVPNYGKSIPACILEYLEEKQGECTLVQLREEVKKNSTTTSSKHFISNINAVLYTLKKENKIVSVGRGRYKINSVASKRIKNEHNTIKSIQ